MELEAGHCHLSGAIFKMRLVFPAYPTYVCFHALDTKGAVAYHEVALDI
jgi:hypothetical protein